MYTMKKACEATGLSYETLKFYCNQGLVPGVKRDSQNRRIFDGEDITWIKGIQCLKNCNMGIEEMKAYIGLIQQGDETIPTRKEILHHKQEELRGELRRIQDSIAYIDWKQSYYDDILAKQSQA